MFNTFQRIQLAMPMSWAGDLLLDFIRCPPREVLEVVDRETWQDIIRAILAPELGRRDERVRRFEQVREKIMRMGGKLLPVMGLESFEEIWPTKFLWDAHSGHVFDTDVIVHDMDQVVAEAARQLDALAQRREENRAKRERLTLLRRTQRYDRSQRRWIPLAAQNSGASS